MIVLGEILGFRYPIYLSFTLRCFQLLVQLVHCSRLGCATAFVASLFALLVCLPVAICLTDVSHIFIGSFLALITSCTLSFHHHVSLSPWDLRPAVMLNTSCPTLKIVVLLCSHHSCTLSTGLTFFNTVSLNFILGFSSFNLHHFIIGVACSGVQRFLPWVLLLTCQFRSPPTITLSPSTVALSSWSIMLPKRLFFILYIQPTCGAQAHMMLTTISCSHWSGLPSVPWIVGLLFPIPFHSCSFVGAYQYGVTCSLPNYFAMYPFHLVSIHTQQTNISRFHHIRQAPSFSRHRFNIQTAHSHAVTVHISHKNDMYCD